MSKQIELKLDPDFPELTFEEKEVKEVKTFVTLAGQEFEYEDILELLNDLSSSSRTQMCEIYNKDLQGLLLKLDVINRSNCGGTYRGRRFSEFCDHMFSHYDESEGLPEDPDGDYDECP